MAITATTLFDGSRGFTIDPEAAYEETGGTVDGGRALRDVYSQGDDVSGPDDPRANPLTYTTTDDGRKTRGVDGQTDARRVRDYVVDGTSVAEATSEVT